MYLEIQVIKKMSCNSRRGINKADNWRKGFTKKITWNTDPSLFDEFFWRFNFSLPYFREWNMWKFSFIMAIYYFINWIVGVETIERGKPFKGENYSREETICGNTVFNNRENVTRKVSSVKGVFSKPSGNLIVARIFCFLS